MKLYNKFFLPLILSAALSSHTVWGMEGAQQQEPQPCFSSNREILLYTRYINALPSMVSPDMRNLQDIINEAEKNPLMQFPDGGAIDASTRTGYLATRARTLDDLYNNLVARDETQRRICYDKIVKCLEDSLAEINLYQPEGIDAQIISSNKGLLYRKLGTSHNEFITYLQCTDESIPLVPKAIDALKKALQFLPALPGSLEVIADTKYSLSCAYCFQAKVQDLDKNLKEARHWRDQLIGFPKLYKNANMAIQLREAQSYASKSKGSQHTKLKRKTGYSSIATKAVPVLERWEKEEDLPIGAQLIGHQAELNNMVNNKKNKPQDICEAAKKIELAFANNLNLPPEKDLITIYERYKRTLHDESGALSTHYMLTYITAFTANNDIAGAQERTDILLALTDKGNSFQLEIIRAGVQNLAGNPRLWLALERKLEEEAKQKAEKKKEKKKRQKQRIIVGEIRVAQEQREAIPETPALKPLAPKKKVAAAAAGADDITEEKFFEPQDLTYKAGKLERHAAAKADRIRAQQVGGDDEKHHEETPTTTHAEERAVNAQGFQNSNLKIKDLYDLKGRTLKKTDKEIEEGGWRLTREDLQAYFEALGCEYKANGGSHRKLSLPKFVHIMHGEELIAIFNEFGGALTLPEWEDHVPYYLRSQIVLARQKLISIALEARQSAKQS